MSYLNIFILARISDWKLPRTYSGWEAVKEGCSIHGIFYPAGRDLFDEADFATENHKGKGYLLIKSLATAQI
ncbi:MAG: hypothetical protein ACFFCW_44705 [Candidatus Hodarchaeota archaeon]